MRSAANSVKAGGRGWSWPGLTLAIAVGVLFGCAWGDAIGQRKTATPADATASVPAGLQFVAIAPCRAADTRNSNGTFGGPELGAGIAREFDLPQSACGIPSTAVAYSLNVTVVPDKILQYLTLWPSGTPQPYVSTLNSYDGRIKANAAIVPAGSNGGISVFTSDSSQVVLDVDGYFVPEGTASALAFYPLTPCRAADTRGATGGLGGPFLAGQTSRSFPVPSSACGIPANAQAYSLNVTAIPHSTLTYPDPVAHGRDAAVCLDLECAYRGGDGERGHCAGGRVERLGRGLGLRIG